MDFFRKIGAGVWNLLKPADASNPVIAETEASEEEIDKLIEKQSGLFSSAAAGIDVTDAGAKLEVSNDPAKPTKTNIKEKVVQIRTRRGKTQSDLVEIKNLNDIHDKVKNSFTANKSAGKSVV